MDAQTKLLNKLEELGIEYKNHEHPPVFTVEEAKQHRDGVTGGHSKNLFLRDKKKNLFLAVLLEDTQLNLNELAKTIDAKRLSFGSAELLDEVLGVIPGSVSPFALINDSENRVSVILEKRMMEEEELNFHPLVNTATTTVKSKDLLKFIESCGHEDVRIIEI